MYRQGDVLVVKVEDPSSIDLSEAKEVNENGRAILAHGEATGHVHAVESPKAKLFDIGKGLAERILDLPEDSVLTHQEHGSVALTSGTYRVIRQREYSAGEIKYVAD